MLPDAKLADNGVIWKTLFLVSVAIGGDVKAVVCLTLNIVLPYDVKVSVKLIERPANVEVEGSSKLSLLV